MSWKCIIIHFMGLISAYMEFTHLMQGCFFERSSFWRKMLNQLPTILDLVREMPNARYTRNGRSHTLSATHCLKTRILNFGQRKILRIH